MRELVKTLPQYDYAYFADSAHVPYGDKTHEEIYALTQKGVAWLFEQGALVVILACNTASAQALRRLQQEWLPKHFPNRRLLGIVIPVAQEVCAQTDGPFGVLGTVATVNSEAYLKEIHKIAPQAKVIQLAAPRLVPLIESGAPQKEIEEALDVYLSVFASLPLGALVLGCTHYPLLIKEIASRMPKGVYIPHVGEVVAKRFADYLLRHPEIEQQLSKKESQEYVTTGDAGQFRELSKRFLGSAVRPKTTA